MILTASHFKRSMPKDVLMHKYNDTLTLSAVRSKVTGVTGGWLFRVKFMTITSDSFVAQTTKGDIGRTVQVVGPIIHLPVVIGCSKLFDQHKNRALISTTTVRICFTSPRRKGEGSVF